MPLLNGAERIQIHSASTFAAHGLEREGEGFVGLLPGGKDTTEWLSWLQLGEALAQLPADSVVWLGACGSASAVPVWSEHILRPRRILARRVDGCL